MVASQFFHLTLAFCRFALKNEKNDLAHLKMRFCSFVLSKLIDLPLRWCRMFVTICFNDDADELSFLVLQKLLKNWSQFVYRPEWLEAGSHRRLRQRTSSIGQTYQTRVRLDQVLVFRVPFSGIHFQAKRRGLSGRRVVRCLLFPCAVSFKWDDTWIVIWWLARCFQFLNYERLPKEPFNTLKP